jgi:hypothetical protein
MVPPVWRLAVFLTAKAPSRAECHRAKSPRFDAALGFQVERDARFAAVAAERRRDCFSISWRTVFRPSPTTRRRGGGSPPRRVEADDDEPEVLALVIAFDEHPPRLLGGTFDRSFHDRSMRPRGRRQRPCPARPAQASRRASRALRASPARRRGYRPGPLRHLDARRGSRPFGSSPCRRRSTRKRRW